MIRASTLSLARRIHPGFIAGNWYQPFGITVATGSAIGANAIRFTPFIVPAPILITDIGARVVGAAAGGLFRIALYAHNPATGRPTGLPLAASGDLSTTTAAFVSTAVTPVMLQPGLYWAAIQVDATGATATFQTWNASSTPTAQLIGSPSPTDMTFSGGSQHFCIRTVVAYAAYGDVTGATWAIEGGTNNAAVLFKAG